MNCVSYYNSFYPKYIQWIYKNKFYYNFAVITINVAVLFIIFLNCFSGWRNAGVEMGCSGCLEKLLEASERAFLLILGSESEGIRQFGAT